MVQEAAAGELTVGYAVKDSSLEVKLEPPKEPDWFFLWAKKHHTGKPATQTKTMYLKN